MNENRDRKPDNGRDEPETPEPDAAEDESTETVTGAPLGEDEEDPGLEPETEQEDNGSSGESDDEEEDEDTDDEPVEISKDAGPGEKPAVAAADDEDDELEDEEPEEDEPEPEESDDAGGDDDDESEEAGEDVEVAAGETDESADSWVKERVGVLLMAYGGPDKLEDVPDYLMDVRGGRPMSQELVDEFVERYREIGGRSPILELTQAQAAGVEKALNSRKAREAGISYKTYVGMRHWHPYIRDVVPEILADGVDKLVAVVMAPHYSQMSIGKYMEQLQEALDKHEADIPVYQVQSWKDQPMFISGVASRIRDALRKFPANARKDVPIIFTAHSLPVRILEWGDPYPDELRVSVEMVADRVRQRHWRFAYQSQGATAEPWLGPDVESTLDELAAEGFSQVLMVPIGFVCDHVEILYDVDIEHTQHAEKLGMELTRIKSLNDGPMLCRAVAEAVRKAMDPGAVSEEAELEEAGVGDEG